LTTALPKGERLFCLAIISCLREERDVWEELLFTGINCLLPEEFDIGGLLIWEELLFAGINCLLPEEFDIGGLLIFFRIFADFITYFV